MKIPKKICNARGCNKLIGFKQSYCDEHKKIPDEANKHRHKMYKSRRQDEWEQKFYASDLWKIIREFIKSREKGFCLLCFSKGEEKYMDTVHHIIELKDNRDLALDPNNLIALCESCHQVVHRDYRSKKMETQNKLKALVQGGIKKFL